MDVSSDISTSSYGSGLGLGLGLGLWLDSGWDRFESEGGSFDLL